MPADSYYHFSSNLEIKEGLKSCKMLNISASTVSVKFNLHYQPFKVLSFKHKNVRNFSTNVINSNIKNTGVLKQTSFNSKQFLRNKHICVNSIIRNSLNFNFYSKNQGSCNANKVRLIHNSSIINNKSNTSVFNRRKDLKAANGFYNFDNNKSKISSTSLDYKNKNLKLNSRLPVYRDIGKTK